MRKREDKKIIAILLSLILAGAFLRLYRLSYQSLWLDEAFFVWRIKLIGAPEIAKNLSYMEHFLLKYHSFLPPFTFFYKWISVFGQSEFSIRLPSAIAGILLIPMSYYMAKRLFNQRVGIYAALLTAISPINIYYSQEAKVYAILSLFSLCSYLFLYLGLKRGRAYYWIGYILTTLFCLHLHTHTIFLVLSQIFFYFFVFREYRMQFALSQTIIFLIYSYHIFIIIQQSLVRPVESNPWIGLPTLKSLSDTFVYFSVLSWRLPLGGYAKIGFRTGLSIFIILFLIGIINFLKDRRIETKLLFTWLFLPILIFFTISFIVKPMYVAGRYDILSFPAFVQIIAVSIDSVKKRHLRNFLVAAIIVSTIPILYNYYFIYNKSNDRIVSEFVQSKIDRDDIVIVTELSITPFKYYWKKSFEPKIFQFPEGPLGYLQKEALNGDRAYAQNQIKILKDKIFPLVNKDNRLWLVHTPINRITSDLISSLRKELECADIIKFPKGHNTNQISEVYIFKRY